MFGSTVSLSPAHSLLSFCSRPFCLLCKIIYGRFQRREVSDEERGEAGTGSHLEESLSVIDEKTVRLRLVLAVKGIQSKTLPLKHKRSLINNELDH